MAVDPVDFDPEALKTWMDIISGIALLIGGILAAFWAYIKFVLERSLQPADFFVDCKTIGSVTDGHLLELHLHVKNPGVAPIIVSNLRIVEILYLTSEDSTVEYFGLEDLIRQMNASSERIRKVVAEKADEISAHPNPGKTEAKMIEESQRRADADTIMSIRASMARLGRVRFPHSLFKTMGLVNYSQTTKPIIADYIMKERQFRRKMKTRRTEIETRGIRIIPYDTLVNPGVDQIYTYTAKVTQNTKYIMVRSSFEYGQVPTIAQRVIFKLSRKLGLIQYSPIHLRAPQTTERVFKV